MARTGRFEKENYPQIIVILALEEESKMEIFLHETKIVYCLTEIQFETCFQHLQDGQVPSTEGVYQLIKTLRSINIFWFAFVS